jgi:monoamine oxidase
MPNDIDSVMSMLDLAIIGAGPPGLSLAEKLLKHKASIGVFEARERCGGRILSASSPADFSAELDATWLWPIDQPRITQLAERLGLSFIPQITDDRLPLFEHPIDGYRSLQLDHWQDKLYFGGTETAGRAGGYLEGALEASDRVFTALKH